MKESRKVKVANESKVITKGPNCKELSENHSVESAVSEEKKAGANRRSVKSKYSGTVDDRKNKDFLTEFEMRRFLDAARSGRHGVRDYAMMLMAYRHGLRVSELIDIRMNDLDLATARL